MKKFFSLLAAAAILMFGSASAADLVQGGYIEAEGVAYVEPGQSLNALRRLAVMDAYRYLAEEVDTLHVSSSTTVVNARMNDEINSAVKAALNGAKVTSVYRDSDGNFHAIARLPVFGGAGSLANAVLPQDVQTEDFPKPKFTNIESGSFDKKYTGLIVDCRGKGISTAISPAIKSADGTKIYSYEQISRQTAIDMGMADYSDKIDEGTGRAGSNPLIVKAISISGECDAVISPEDADRILTANQSAHFLDNCMVVIVR